MDLPEDSVDAWRFEALVRTGRAALDNRDPFTTTTVTAQALDRGRGTPLSDLAEGGVRTGQATRRLGLNKMFSNRGIERISLPPYDDRCFARPCSCMGEPWRRDRSSSPIDS